MSRKAICPICEKVFMVRRTEVCCCEEHRKQWESIQKRRWDAHNKYKPGDLEWANERLEVAIGEIMAVGAELNNTRYALNHAREDKGLLERRIKELEATSGHEDLDAAGLDLEWANYRLEAALYDWRAHAKAAEKITCEVLELREKLVGANDKIRELENAESEEIKRLEKELASKDESRAYMENMRAVAKTELEESKKANVILREELQAARNERKELELRLETAKGEIASLAKERGEARAAKAKDGDEAKKGGKSSDQSPKADNPETPQKENQYRNVCSNCGNPFRTSRKDEKFCSDQCFHEYTSMGLM